jgi:hypothetical protein
MTLARSATATCNQCGEDITLAYGDWDEFMEQFRSAGWRSRKNGEEWEHFCPECRY